MRVAGADADAVQEGGGGSVANTRSGTAKNWLSNNGSHEGPREARRGEKPGSESLSSVGRLRAAAA